MTTAAVYVSPATEQSLLAYVAAYGNGMQASDLFVLLGCDPTLAVRVDERLQVLPIDIAERIAAYLARPVAEVIWAAGGKALTAPAPGDRRRTY